MTKTNRVTFGDLVGRLDTDANSLRWFIELWFEEDDIVTIQKLPHDGKRQFLALPAKHLHANAEMILNQKAVEGTKNEFYYGINPVAREIHNWSDTRRQAGFGYIKGFYADLDVKNGAFESREQILSYIEGLEIQPTTVVESGSGGMHLTWKITGQIEPEDLKGWWAYLQSKAPEGVGIDRLVNVDRIFRLPGSLRWSKNGSLNTKLQLINGSRKTHTIEDARNLTKEPLEQHRNRQKMFKAQKTVMLDRKFNSVNTGKPGLIKSLCEMKADEMDWSEILEPEGWSLLRESSDGSRQWIRPGSSQKSAVTDYTHSDGTVSGVMSLLSSSPDSGLLDLKEVGIPLTKFHILLRLRFEDDLDALINHFINKEKNR